MYELQLIGRLGKDAEVKTTDYGSFINFSVAHDERVKDGTKNTIWTLVRFKPREGSTIAQYLKKGVSVYVKGRPGAYAGKDGEIIMTLTAYQLELVSGTPKPDGGTAKSNALEQMNNIGFKEEPDLPF